MDKPTGSAGIVHLQTLTFAAPPHELQLERGVRRGQTTLANGT